jgi:hypothetical protein
MHSLRIVPVIMLTLAVAVMTLHVSSFVGAPAVASESSSGVNVVFIYNDLSILATEHLAPSDGDILGDVTDIVASLNAKGGMDGHRIDLMSYKMPSLSGSAATDQAACLAATETDHADIVLIGDDVDDAVGQCVTVQHKTLAIVSGGPALSDFQQADGRLFATGSNAAMDAERLARATASVASDGGYLKNAKVGVVVQGTDADQEVVSSVLIPTLERLGHKVVAKATVPFPTGAETCSDTAPAIQVMKQAGATAVFLVAYDLCGVALVTAAQQDDFQPKWITNADNTVATVSHFFAPVKDAWNGALGISQQFPASDTEAKCVQQALVPNGLNYAPSSDAYQIATQACIQLDDIAQALGKLGSGFSTDSMIAALETERDQPSNGGPPGSWSKSQHDAGDWVHVERYSASEGTMLPIADTTERVPCPCAP